MIVVHAPTWTRSPSASGTGTPASIGPSPSFTVVPFVAPFAWYIGNQALREIDADPGRYGRRDWVHIGRILGIVGTVVLGLVLLMFCGFLATWIATFATVSPSL